MINKMAANGIIIKRNKVLLLKRSLDKDLFADYWCCPGGGHESRETPEECAIREVKEESNLDFKPKKLVFSGVDNDTHAMTYSYVGEWEGEIKLNHESSKFGWFSYKELSNLKLAFKFKEILDEIHNKGYF